MTKQMENDKTNGKRQNKWQTRKQMANDRIWSKQTAQL